MKVWLTILALTAVVLGLRTGWNYATFTEGAAIERAAADYVMAEAARGHAARPTDCAGRPGGSAAWVIVTCVPGHLGPGEVYEYRIDRGGGVRKTAPY